MARRGDFCEPGRWLLYVLGAILIGRSILETNFQIYLSTLKFHVPIKMLKNLSSAGRGLKIYPKLFTEQYLN